MKRTEPTMTEWRELYSAAIDFMNQGCWNDMWDSDIFGVRNLETGMVGYCCVMGRNGEHFALAVYRGLLGLEGILRILNDEVDVEGNDALHVQHCLMVSFEDRRYLDQKDLEVIKKLGLKFRGRNTWPRFRDYTPGYLPWFITGDDARFLTIALRQSIEMAERMKNDPEVLLSEDDSFFLVRTPYEDGGRLSWRDEWLQPESLSSIKMSKGIEINPDFRKRIDTLQKRRSHSGTWEIGTFYMPGVVREGTSRPYCPKTALFMDHDSYFILAHFMSKPEEFFDGFINDFLSLLEKTDYLPSNIIASDEEILASLFPITQNLKIDLLMVERLNAVEDAKQSMTEFFGQK